MATKHAGEIELSDALSTTFAGIKMRSPLGISAINMPLGERSAITPELHAEVLLKHAEAGAGFVYVPGANYMTKELIESCASGPDHEKRPRRLEV